MLGGRKRYIGTFQTEEEAARVFDKFTLVYRGLKVIASVLGWSAILLGKNELRIHTRRANGPLQIGICTHNLLTLTLFLNTNVTH